MVVDEHAARRLLQIVTACVVCAGACLLLGTYTQIYNDPNRMLVCRALVYYHNQCHVIQPAHHLIVVMVSWSWPVLMLNNKRFGCLTTCNNVGVICQGLI